MPWERRKVIPRSGGCQLLKSGIIGRERRKPGKQIVLAIFRSMREAVSAYHYGSALEVALLFIVSSHTPFGVDFCRHLGDGSRGH